jgi:resuscitation-promoting factor RpfA
MNAVRRSMLLLTLVAAEVSAVVALARLGSRAPFALDHRHLDAWLRTTAPADGLAAVLRVVALAGCGWLLLSTASYAAARACRIPAAIRAVRWCTPAAVRRVVDAALAVSVVAGTVLTPAVARATPSTPAVTAGTGVRDGHGGALESLPAEPAPTTAAPTATTPPTTSAPPTSAPSTTPTPPTPLPLTVVVAPGDSLWELAAGRVALATARARADVGDAEIARYWLSVCDANTPTLRSGDPDLIFPGEVVTLPPAR